jgi:hypothetical protein
MMNNSKILTVSYGTFSCTLEGFDDSFGTMKAIAEYFRDLAADDRYFGAEPPQPDADMLARIAQREVSRRVQAHERDGKIVLSALEDQREQPELQPAQPAPTVVAPIVAQAVVADTAPEQPEIDTPAEVALTDASAEKAPEPIAISASDAAQAFDEAPIDTPSDQPAVFEEDENDIVPGQPDAEVEAFFADAKTPEVAENAVSAEDTPEQTETIAAKLQRIRAVVAQTKSDDAADGYAEDQHADATPEHPHDENADEQSNSDVLSGEFLDAADDEGAESARDAEAESRDDNEQAAINDAVTSDETLAADDDDDDDDDVQDDSDVDAILSRLASASSADEDELDGIALPVDADTSNLFEDTIIATDAPSDRLETLVSEAPSETAPRARVIKVKRAELEAAIRKGSLEEYDDEAGDEVTADAPTADIKSLDQIAPSRSKKTSLTPEAEQELARELSSLEMDIEAEAQDDAPEETPKVAVRRPSLRKEVSEEAAQTDEGRETDVSRLLAEADQQMDEPESATRRDAFAHLRAAVASHKADDAMGSAEKDDNSDDVYRDDLAKVVRPRRPASPSQRTARPGEGRPAPLKLVAEQRIDVENTRSEGPVRPRRIAAAAVSEPAPATQDDISFAEYAAEMGAATLPQLLEAAASYMSFVEGRDQFSRPQLMTKVRQSGAQEDFSREDGLRSFGQLLRAGKISKIKGGRFTVSDDIGFQPDNREAG